MSEQASRREFLIASAAAGAGLAAGCGTDDGSGSSTEPIGDPNYYPNSPRQPTGPMDTNMPICPSTAGLLQGPDATSLPLNSAKQVSGFYYVYRDSKGVFALNIQCPHAGCTPALQPNSQTWVCPCHGSQFALDGSLINGPAPRPLPRYPVCKGSDGKLYIDTSKSA
jgi:Rieske Fe-S protein